MVTRTGSGVVCRSGVFFNANFLAQVHGGHHAIPIGFFVGPDHNRLGQRVIGMGTPQNLFIDQGGVMYDFRCSFTPGGDVQTIIAGEVNPETCE